MEKKILAIVQARLTSTRFPNKILEKLGNKNLLEFLLQRLNRSKKIDQIVIAMPNNTQKKLIENLTKKTNFFFGSENDVLDRYYKTAKKYKGETIIRICGDCPFIDPDIVDNIINEFQKKN